MANPTFRVNLDPAAVLYVRKLARRTRAEIPARVIELPSFEYAIDVREPDERRDRQVIKDWVRYVALAHVHSCRQRGADGAFVALIRAEMTPARLAVTIQAPRPDIIEPTRNRPALESLLRELADLQVDVHHKYAVLDTLCPLVFQYRRADDHVLVSNEHHLRDPGQFLAIDRVDSTSGFLNFIGAWSMLSLADETGAYMQRIPPLLREAMAAREEEWLRWCCQAMEEQIYYESARVLIDPDRPERYYYDYVPKTT